MDYIYTPSLTLKHAQKSQESAIDTITINPHESLPSRSSAPPHGHVEECPIWRASHREYALHPWDPQSRPIPGNRLICCSQV